eukprot:CFRG7134T1
MRCISRWNMRSLSHTTSLRTLCTAGEYLDENIVTDSVVTLPNVGQLPKKTRRIATKKYIPDSVNTIGNDHNGVDVAVFITQKIVNPRKKSAKIKDTDGTMCEVGEGGLNKGISPNTSRKCKKTTRNAEPVDMAEVKGDKVKKKRKAPKAKAVPVKLPTVSDSTVRVAGIDYGSQCAAVCVFKGKIFNFEQCKFMYVTTRKKCHGEFMDGQLLGNIIESGKMGMGRYLEISEYFHSFFVSEKPESVGLENYSMRSQSMSHLIGEHHGILKYRMHTLGLDYYPYAPTSIKLSATGKGNADKEDVVKAFIKETGVNLQEVFKTRKEAVTPINDIVDSYYHDLQREALVSCKSYHGTRIYHSRRYRA